jgi:hypothetical protein
MKKWLVAAFAAAIALVAVELACLYYLMAVPRVSTADMRSQVEADLPPGTSREEVADWLEERGADWYNVGEPDGERIALAGRVKKVYRLELFNETVIDYEFHFDEHNNLVSYTIEEHTLGL